MNSSEIKTLAKDFVSASAEIKNMVPESQGYGYTYTSLGCIIDQIKPILNKYNMCVIQSPSETEVGVGIETIILHNSGEFLKFTYTMPVTMIQKANESQKVGASITYGRRYALSAIFGIATETDTDSIAPEDKNPEREKKPFVISDKMQKHIEELILPSHVDDAIKKVKAEKKYSEYEESLIVDALNKRLLQLREVK